MTTPLTITIGSIVRLAVPPPAGEQHWARGRLCAIESYTDDNGTRTWYYVRWFDKDGKPDSEPMKHALAELEPA